METPHSDPLQGLVNQLALTEILEGCILAPDFSVTADWVVPFRLTDAGMRLIDDAAAEAPDLSDSDLRLAMFLEWQFPLVHRDFDTDGFLEVISTATVSRQLLFANNLGRRLHDAMAAACPGPTDSLEYPETVAVLQGLPQGVYQFGQILIGPLGCHRVSESRLLPPRSRVPGYLCSDSTCFQTHHIQLTTDIQSGIVRARNTVDYLRRRNLLQPDHLLIKRMRPSGVITVRGESPALFDLLADGFSDSELLTILKSAYRRADDTKRAQLRALTNHGSDSLDEALSVLDSSSLLQLLLIHDDSEVEAALDLVTRTGEMPLGPYELRKGRVEGRWSQSSHLHAHLSRYGIRYTHTTGSVASRVLPLVHRIYFTGEAHSPEDLAFVLDDSASSKDDQLLIAALDIGDSEEIVRRLLVADRRATQVVADEFNIAEWQDLTKSDLILTVLWKLGAKIVPAFEELNQIASHMADLQLALERGAPETEMRGHLANLFNAIENALKRTLTFSTWALTTDHVMDREGFQYDPDLGSDSLQFIEEVAPSSESRFRLATEGRNSFAALVAGHARLAESLQRISPQDSLRPHVPAASGHSAPQRPQVFNHTLPYHDLTPRSQEAIVEALRQVSSLMGASTVTNVRNAGLHGDNPFPDLEQFSEALARVDSWCELLLESGLFPVVSTLIEGREDAMGRRTYWYQSSHGIVRLTKPQWHDSKRMPSTISHLVIMPSASLGPAGPLRFRVRIEGDDDRWRGYPKRWIEAAGAVHADDLEPADE